MNERELEKIYFDDFELDERRRQLMKANKSVPLNAKAFDLLIFLTKNSGRLISKDEILNSIWKDQFVEESNLAVQISAIRKALGDRTTKPHFLVTIPGKGYQFIAEVSGSNDTTDQIQNNETVESEVAKPEAGAYNKSKPRTQIGIRIFAVVAAVILSIFGGVWATRYFASPVIKSIAVVPFSSQTAAAESEYLGDGLAEGLIFSLSRLPGLKVMSRDTTFRYRDVAVDAKKVGREIGVEAIVTGRIVQLADTVSIRIEFVSTDDNSVIWGEQFTRKVSEVGKLKDDIAQSITRELGIKLGGSDEQLLKSNQTNDTDAYQLYLIGRYQMNRLTDDGFVKGQESFRQAIAKDPNYALAHAALADSYNLLCGWGAMAPNEGFPLAKTSALRALELDETLAEAHTALGTVKLFYDADWRGAEKEFARAIDINPSYAEAHQMYGYELMMQGRFDEATPFVARASELDPLSIARFVAAGDLFYFKRDHTKAIEAYQKAIAMDGNSGIAHWSMGNALFLANRVGDAIAEYQKAIPLSGDSPDEPASLAIAYAINGNPSEARKILESLRAAGRNGYVPSSLIATIHAALGENDEAFEYLEQAFRERDSVLIFLKVDPMFDPLRSDPRFPVLLQRVGLDP